VKQKQSGQDILKVWLSADPATKGRVQKTKPQDDSQTTATNVKHQRIIGFEGFGERCDNGLCRFEIHTIK
jgi:hypothetical protein